MGLNSSKNKGADSSTALSSKSIRKAIRNKQLAPILEGRDDDPAGTLDECPICLLHYPAINTAACCGSSLCTDCYIQVAVSRSEHDAGSCPFCNKANYSVTYRAKSAAQRAAERKEREHVEQAVLHARQEEDRRAEQRRSKHAANASTPMSPEQGSLAEEWSRAQEEEERYLSSRQDRWREALARAAAAAEAGDEADDMDVEELMIMQALLLSLDEQHSGTSGTEGASGSSHDVGSSSRDGDTAAAQAPREGGHQPPGRGGSFCSAVQAAQDAGHLSAGGAISVAAAASGAPPLSDTAAVAEVEGSTSEAADIPDAELLAHAARLAERAVALQPRQLGSTRPQDTLAAADATNAETSARAPASVSCDATVAYVQQAALSADSGVSSGFSQRQDHASSRFGSAALADALANARGLASASPAALHSRLLSNDSNGGSSAPAGIGSAALAQALAAANGWGVAGKGAPASEHAAQVAAVQQPPFLGIVMVQAAAHIQAPTDSLSMQPAGHHQSAAGVMDGGISSSRQARAAGPVGSATDIDPADNRSTQALDEAGGAALLLQPDGTSLLVLLINASAAAAAAKAAAAALPAEVAQGTSAAAGLAGPGVPLYQINCEDAADRHLAAALAAADAALMQRSQAAVRQQTLAMQTADEQYRVALDAYAARDAAMQQALRESDERLKAVYRSL